METRGARISVLQWVIKTRAAILALYPRSGNEIGKWNEAPTGVVSIGELNGDAGRFYQSRTSIAVTLWLAQEPTAAFVDPPADRLRELGSPFFRSAETVSEFRNASRDLRSLERRRA